MSIRNIDADLASNKLNELFHLHRYEDCALFINRLSYLTIKIVISQISIDMYLSRLPYTIEIFEAIYAKIFIMDPENFPIRTLQPERLLDRMISYFSLLSDQSEMEPVDGPKMLDSFENVIRIISYVQPNLYSRLLYFKFAIDKALLTFEKDLTLLNKSLKSHLISKKDKERLAKNGISSNVLSNSRFTSNEVNNFLLISRATNVQSCEMLRNELIQTVQNCDKALNKLNEHIANLKSQKAFKDVQFYLNQLHEHQVKEEKDSATTKKSNETTEEKDLDTSLPIDEKRTSRKSKRSPSNTRSESVSTRDKSLSNRDTTINRSKLINKSTICQEFIQNRLYLNKAMMNSIEPFLETIKLQQLLDNFYEKIDIDKEILLVFTYLKKEEKYLDSLESLEPLFRRYSLGFERCIRIWRRKCSADSLLLANDRLGSKSLNEVRTNTSQPIEQLYILDSEESNQLDRIQSSFTSSAVASAALNNEENINNLNNNPVANSNMSINSSNIKGANKFLSDADLYTGPMPSIYCTMPTKLKYQKQRIKLNLEDLNSSNNTNENNNNNNLNPVGMNKSSTMNMNNIDSRPKSILIKNSLSQSNIDNLIASKINNASNQGINSNQIEAVINNLDNCLKLNDVDENSATIGTNSKSELKDSLNKVNNFNTKLHEIEHEQHQQQIFNHQLKDEIERLTQELNSYKDTVNKMKNNENKLMEKLKEKECEQSESTNLMPKLVSSETLHFTFKESTITNKNNSQNSNNNNNNANNNFTNYQYTSDIIYLYKNLNNKYRCDAFDALNHIKEIKDMTEFKLKLLFSVVILANRYVKIYIRDLKRKVKSILQITEGCSERSNSTKSQQTTPTIVIQKPTDNNNNENHTSKYVGRYSASRDVNNRKSSDSSENSASLIENALNKYLQVCTVNNSFDLDKIVDDVKNQLWSTLHEYPLKECHELNLYITESVKTCWSFINHQPPFRLDYSNTRYDVKLHERTDKSNKQNDHIIQYIWPSLIDTSDNSCLSRGIVIT